jgi:hypothetical protein
MNLTADDLVDKLQDFGHKYPDLHAKMVTLLKTYEAMA